MVDHEQRWADLVYLVRRGKGRPVSPEGRWPLLFELDDPLSDLPAQLAQHGSVAHMGQQERVATVAETTTRNFDGSRSDPMVRTRAAIQQTSLYAFYPPRLRITDE
jgi:hypothetical protein